MSTRFRVRTPRCVVQAPRGKPAGCLPGIPALFWAPIAFLLSASLCTAASVPTPQFALPEDCELTGACSRTKDVLRADDRVSLTVPAKSGQTLRLRFRLNVLAAPLSIATVSGQAKKPIIGLVAADGPAQGWSVPVGHLPKALVMVGRNALWIRPNLFFYIGREKRGGYFYQYAPDAVFEERDNVLAHWNDYTASTDAVLAVEVEVPGKAAVLSVQGRYISTTPLDAPADKLLIELSSGNELLEVSWRAPRERDRFLPIDLACYSRPGRLVSYTMSLEPGLREIEGTPFEIPPAGVNIDVGLSRWLEEAIDPADFCDNYYTRSAFDGVPESIILRVPKRPYSFAHCLCVVEPDAGKSPVLSTRLTCYGNSGGDSGGRGDAIADSTVFLPRGDEPLPEGVRKVGQITLPSGARQVNLPLYLVSVPLEAGKIPDILSGEAPTYGRENDFLDLELTREIGTCVHYFAIQNRHTKPIGLPSSVHVLALTLERSPIEFRLVSSEVGNIFYAASNPRLGVELDNRGEATTAKLAYTIGDFYGRYQRKELEVALPAAGKKLVEIDLNAEARDLVSKLPGDGGGLLGWFSLVFDLRDGRGRWIWRQPTTFALLPPDKRVAGPESPFGTWWFRSAHGGTADVGRVGPILLKMGVRHVCPGPESDEQLRPYKLSHSMIPWYGRRAGTDPKVYIQDWLKRCPSVRWGMVFHETGIAEEGQVFPPGELLGLPPPRISAQGEDAFKKLWDQAIEVAKAYREAAPNVKITFGNSWPNLMIAFMRRGFPKEYMDALGLEGVGDLKMPERQPEAGAFQQAWWLQEMRNRYGYKDIPISSGYEWICRNTSSGSLDERDQADWYVRDALHALAYRMPSVNLGLLDDVPDAYYYTIYASSGYVHRSPLLNPKPSYVEFATMTQMVDGAEYKRWLDTGSRSLYCLEFRYTKSPEARPSVDGKRPAEWMYALWTLCGERKIRLSFERNSPLAYTDAMGNEIVLDAKRSSAEIIVSPSPCYLTTLLPVVTAEAGEAYHFSRPPEKVLVIDNLAVPANWVVQEESDRELETFAFDYVTRKGKFKIEAVQDELKGPTMEITLLPQPDVPEIASRYLILRARDRSAQPGIPVPGRPTELGLWVKGNSSWGRIIFEFLDAKDERWISIGEEPERWNVADWESRTNITFDGWRYVKVNLPNPYPGGHPGPRDREWRYRGGDRKVDYPIRFSRLIVELRDKVVYVTDLVPVPNLSVRVRDLTAGYGRPE